MAETANSSTVGVLSREPDNINFLSPVGFRFGVRKMPHVNWFIQEVSLPGISIVEVEQPNPLGWAYQPGEKLTYDPLNITFKVDEDLKTWQELQNWMVGIGSPREFGEYKTNLRRGQDAIISDATLIIMDSNMNANFEILFHDLFPTTLSELQFITTDSEIDYITVSATFRYLNYEFRAIS